MDDLDVILGEIKEELGEDNKEENNDEGMQGLGRGLNALFEDEESNDVIEDEIEQRIQSEPEPEEIAVDLGASADLNIGDSDDSRPRLIVGIEQLAPSPYQPRRVFNDESIEELASSIAQYGVLQPLLVRENPEKLGSYEIIAGERRWRASQRAQLHELPVIILEISELDAVKIALIENLQREDLDPIEEAMGYKKLLEEYEQTQEGLAKAVGKSRPHITNMIRLLNLPDQVQAHLSAGDLTMGHARALITAPDPENLAKQVIAKGLSVRQTEKFAAGSVKKPEGKSETKPAVNSSSTSTKDADTIALENDISNALGMKVSIDSVDGKSGSLSVEFKSLDQLDEVLHRLAHFPGSRLNG